MAADEGTADVVMHADQVDVSVDVVRRLVAEQFPQWADRLISRLPGSGTVNAIFRVGDGLTARFPLVAQDPGQVRAQLRAEAEAAAELARCSPVPTPTPVAIGEPGHGYPMPWSLQTWVPGRVAVEEDPASSLGFAHDLATFVQALRHADTRGRRFAGSGRGGRLADHDDWVETSLRNSDGLVDVSAVRRLWRGLSHTPRHGSDVMTHGDLIPGNVLVRDGRLAGVLDCGGFGPADPALELVAAWHLLDHERRAVLRRALGCDDDEWARGAAWALVQAIGALWYYAETNPAMSRMGRRTLHRLLTDT